MVQVKGRLRLLTQRFSKDFAGRVKYSTLWPSRRDSRCEARRAMPTSGDFCGRGNREREPMRIRLLFANNKCFRRHCQARDAGEDAPPGSRRDGGATVAESVALSASQTTWGPLSD